MSIGKEHEEKIKNDLLNLTIKNVIYEDKNRSITMVVYTNWDGTTIVNYWVKNFGGTTSHSSILKALAEIGIK